MIAKGKRKPPEKNPSPLAFRDAIKQSMPMGKELFGGVFVINPGSPGEL